MSTIQNAAFRRLFDDVGTVDQVGIEERVAKFQTRSIKKKSKLWG
jgi:deoxyribose-phosphate aldolase